MRQNLLAVAIAVVVAVLWGVPHAFAARLALLIGNDTYVSVPKLQKAANDARKIAATLQGIGFEVSSFTNLTQVEMSTRMVEFTSKIQPGDVVLFFFAGHGVQLAERNYLLPVDVPLAAKGQEDLVKDRSFTADAVVERIRARGAKTTIMVLDACRDNPFKQEGGRSLVGAGGGLANMSAAEGVFIMFSASANQEALDRLSDKDSDPNSVFTRFFAKHIAEPGASMLSVAKRTQTDVRRLAQTVGRVQMPAFYDQIEGDLVLVPKQQQQQAQQQQGQQQQGQQQQGAQQQQPVQQQQGVQQQQVQQQQGPQQQKQQQAALPDPRQEEQAPRQRQQVDRGRDQGGRPPRPREDDGQLRDTEVQAEEIGPVVPVPLRAQNAAGANTPKRAGVTECDRLAASPYDPDRAPEVSGLLVSRIDVRAAAPACEQAMRDNPGVARFAYQAGRVASAQKDYPRAKDLFEKALAAKHFAAATALGFMHQTGSGMPKDPVQAKRFYELAAAQRDTWGMINLGRLHESGALGERKYNEARRLYEAAANAGESNGLNLLGLMVERGRGGPANPRDAIKLYEKAAQKRNPSAMVNLARLFDRGIGVSRDPAIARRWLEKAVAENYAPAMHTLGVFAMRDEPQADPAIARGWYQKAAVLNHAPSMTNLGLLHLRAQGGPPNPAEAKRLFEAAAALGNRSAMNQLGLLYRDGIGVRADLAEARRWFVQSAERNFAPAMRNLGRMFETGGPGVQSDLREAERWFERAALAEEDGDRRRR